LGNLTLVLSHLLLVLLLVLLALAGDSRRLLRVLHGNLLLLGSQGGDPLARLGLRALTGHNDCLSLGAKLL
jgi:hypothetical protein